MAIVWRGKELTAKVRAAAMRGLIKGAMRVQADAIRRIEEPPKTGRLYRRRSIVHQASAPGEAPATDLGNLVISITINPIPARLRVNINAGASYAAALEFGTKHIEPRPYMRVSLIENLPQIKDDVSDAIRIAL